jgi:hypothetical protein
MAGTPHDGSGTIVTFLGASLGLITGVTVNKVDITGSTEAGIDVSHLGQTTGATMLSQAKPLKPAVEAGTAATEVTVDYIGSNLIAGGASGAFVVSGGVGVSGTATCTGSSVTLGVNDVTRGSATFKVS